VVRRICIDTDVMIELINEGTRIEDVFGVIEEEEVFTTTVNVFELTSRATNLQEIYKFLESLEVLSFHEEEAIEASNIRKELKRKGKMIHLGDIFIAAIAKINKCELLTFNRKHFENISNLKLIKL